MPVRRREVELSVERPVGPGATVARLTARLDAGPDGSGPSPAELKAALGELLADLDAAVGLPLAGAPLDRPDRELAELVETYRPRRPELVEALLADGEITSAEHALLMAHLRADRPAPERATAPAVPVPDRPIAAAPAATDRSLPPARPVPELLQTYQIASLKQAGAVRARRQISFAEYMALKRHFEARGADGDGPAP